MKNIKSVNSEVFQKIICVSKQREDEFNNGQTGATILFLLVAFFVPFLFLNVVRQWLQIDYSLTAGISMFVISAVVTFALYKIFNIGKRFADKNASLNTLLSEYVPNNKIEFTTFKTNLKQDPSNLFELVEGWVQVEKTTYA